MKRLKFLAGFAALAMLGACSSEDPEIVGQTPATVEDDGMFISIDLVDANAETRASSNNGTVDGEGEENKIYDVRLVIIDSDNVTQVDALASVDNSEVTQADGAKTATAYFKIPSIAFNTLKDKATGGAHETDVELFVWVNAAKSGIANWKEYHLCSGLNASCTEDPATVSERTWYGEETIPAEEEGGTATKVQRYFQFANANTAKGKLLAPAAGADGSAANSTKAWKLYSDIAIDRLAVRFDYEGVNTSYELLGDEDVTLTDVKFAVNTISKQTFVLPRYSTNGTATNTIAFGDATRKYAASPTIGTVTLSKLKDHSYTLTSSNKKVYGRPCCIPTSVTGTPAYSRVAYAAVKAKFTCSRFTTTGAGIAVYAFNGVLAGTIADIKGYKTNPMVAHYPANATKAIKDLVDEAVEAINTYAKTIGASDTNENIDAQLTGGYIKCVKFTPDAAGNYYCYYNHRIESKADTDPENPVPNVEKYNILRNHIYNLGVSSFGLLGMNGDQTPQDPTNEEINELYVTLNVTVNPWKLNTTNGAWTF